MKRAFAVFGFSLVFVITLVAARTQAQTPTLFQHPTVSRTQIVFCYAGDLWSVPRQGGDATRLTSGIGVEYDPSFSPDGKMIAFTGQYDGNTDVFVIPASGGVPKRLTYHPGPDDAVGWTPDSKRVLFRSPRNSTGGYNRLFTVSVAGGFPEQLPLPLAYEGSLSPDGSEIAYMPLTRWQPDWKRYHGGQTAPIWIAKLADSTIQKVPRENSNDFDPMWVGDKVYFLSDRSGAVTLYSYDVAAKSISKVVENTGLDFKSASAGPDAIAYEQFGTIHLYDLKTGKTNKVDIHLAGDLVTVRPHYEKVGPRIAAAAISPTGARAVFEARGEIITVPAEKGDPRDITNTTAVMERDPSWSPDGKWIAYFSDESGEYSLHLRDQSGMDEVKKIKLSDHPTFYYSPTWSPDSKKIAYYDKALTLWYVDVDNGTPIKVDQNPDGLHGDVMDPFWSPDSRWIGYVKQVDNHLRAIFVYSLEKSEVHQLTDGMSDARYGDFDKSGKYLYFAASTDLGPAFSFAEMSTFPFRSTRSVYAIVLRNDLPSPIAPQSDEEKVQADKKAASTPPGGEKAGENPAENGEAKKSDDAQAPAAGQPPAGQPHAKNPPEPVRIDFEAIDQRIIALPIPSLNFVNLQAGKPGTIFLLEFPPAGPDGGGFGPPSLT
ncbi:MAG: S41 family peptidase, partial [Blastocatellia bacterium]